MKFLKYAGITILALVIIFFAIGLFVPSLSYSSEVEIDAPIEHVWSVFTDGDRMGEWIPNLVSVTLIEGEQDAIGSVYEMVVEEGSDRIVMTETVNAFKENETYAFLLEADVLKTQVDINFTSEGEKTHLKATSKVEGKTMIWRSLFALMKSGFASEDLKSYVKLKEAIEATPIPEPEPEPVLEEEEEEEEVEE